MDELYKAIANLGFPIAVSLFLLLRIEVRLSELTKSIIELSNVLEKKND